MTTKADNPTAFQVAGHTVNRHVVSHIKKVSDETGISFSYLMAQAGRESSFRPNAGSSASSAAGLYQFTRATWLSLVKRHGADYGLGDMAEAIKKTAKGEFVVEDPALRQRILDLRRDPQLSAQMAGEYANENKARLERQLGRAVDATDLYLAHFLGPAGAARMLKAKAADPDQPAAEVTPTAAAKNPTVFYDTDQSARSVSQVYERIQRAIEKPMQQYAGLEKVDTAAAATADQQWPFETGQKADKPLPSGPAETVVADALSGTVGDWQSADKVSMPMPPAIKTAAVSEGDKAFENGINKIFQSVRRNLFG